MEWHVRRVPRNGGKWNRVERARTREPYGPNLVDFFGVCDVVREVPSGSHVVLHNGTMEGTAHGASSFLAEQGGTMVDHHLCSQRRGNLQEPICQHIKTPVNQINGEGEADPNIPLAGMYVGHKRGLPEDYLRHKTGVAPGPGPM